MKSHLRYAYAILAVPLSVLLRFALIPLTGPGTPFITLFPATVIIALLGGMGPAILTGVLGVLASDYFFVTPLHSFDISIDFWSRSAVVVLTSIFVGYVGKVLRDAKYGLEIKVKERTADLDKTVAELQREVEHRIQAEEIASNERQRFYDVLETLPAYVCLLTPDYRMPFANRIFREWFGYYPNKKCYEFLFGRSEPCEFCETYTVLKTNKPYRWEWKGPNGRNYDIFDFPFKDTDGSQLILEMGIDITERKQAEASLKEQARTMDAFFEHTITPIVFLDRDFNFIRVNEAYAKACQRDISEFKGHNHFEFYPNEENQRIFEKVIRTKTPYEAHAKPFSFPDHPEWGITYWDWTLVPILDDSGGVEFLVFSLEDVTKRKKAQDKILADQEQLRALSSELLIAEEQERRKIAVDLHDSIGQILAFLKIELGNMLRFEMPKESVRILKHVLEQVKLAIKQTRTLTFEISPPELYALGLEAALEELTQRFAEEHDLKYRFEATDEPKPLNENVKICLYRSVRELLINALKHAKAKMVGVTVCKINDNIQIAVEDDGKGIKVSELNKYSAYNSSGFGLFSIREQLGRIDGRLDIQSDYVQGTKVILIAPLESKGQEKEH